MESAADSRSRLADLRIRQRLRIASEFRQARARRLEGLRMRHRLNTARQSTQVRALNIQAQRRRQSIRRATETLQARASRLTSLRVRQRVRIAREAAQQRARRLAGLRIRQSLRIAHETALLRARRLQDLRLRTASRRKACTIPQPTKTSSATAQLRLEEPQVQDKMRKFHAHMENLCFAKCTTCAESLPATRFRRLANECLRCSRDSKAPKLYSSGNNMHPGNVPHQLQVCFATHTNVSCYIYIYVQYI